MFITFFNFEDSLKTVKEIELKMCLVVCSLDPNKPKHSFHVRFLHPILASGLQEVSRKGESQNRKIVTKLASPVASVIKLFLAVSYDFSN
jgi:hypothetical protein